MTTSARLVVVGDVHGCLEELDELLKLLAIRPGIDTLVFVGDLLDRGPDPVGCVRRVRELGASCVMGNHEDKHLRYRFHRQRAAQDSMYKNPMREFPPERLRQHLELSAEDWGWIEKLPLSTRFGFMYSSARARSVFVCHAGIEPVYGFDKQRAEALIMLRWVHCDGTRDMRRIGVQPTGSVPWPEKYPLNEQYAASAPLVLFGHHIHADRPTVWRNRQRLEQWTAEELAAAHAISLDTGCASGGALTALVLEAAVHLPREFVSVKARANYYGRKGD